MKSQSYHRWRDEGRATVESSASFGVGEVAEVLDEVRVGDAAAPGAGAAAVGRGRGEAEDRENGQV